jgi:hypothetical protein
MGKYLHLVVAVWCIIIGGMIYFANGEHWLINAKVAAVVSVALGLVGAVVALKAPSATATH